MTTVLRRAHTALVIVMLALWGAGVPRFVHVMTAHVPADGGAETSCAASCCSSCSLASAGAETDSDDEPQTDHDSEGTHDCPICDLLGVMVSAPLQEPAISTLAEPAIDAPASSAHVMRAAVEFDPHAPRGPPTTRA